MMKNLKQFLNMYIKKVKPKKKKLKLENNFVVHLFNFNYMKNEFNI